MNRIVEVISATEWKIRGLHDSRMLVVDRVGALWICIPLYHMNGFTNVMPLFKYNG